MNKKQQHTCTDCFCFHFAVVICSNLTVKVSDFKYNVNVSHNSDISNNIIVYILVHLHGLTVRNAVFFLNFHL